jgi:NitT/TauT family transport system substrate-binding protein
VDSCDELDSLVTPRRVPKKVLIPGMTRRSLLGTLGKLAIAAPLLAACDPAPATRPAAPAGQPAQTGAGQAPVAGPRPANMRKIELAFCSQVLCGVPLEVARTRGFWEAEGLDVTITYARGGAQAANTLVSGGVDWVVTGFDVIVQTVSRGRDVTTIASLSRLPFFALAASPREPSITTVRDLVGKKIGVGNLGTTDHLLAQFLLTREGVDLNSIEFVASGPNLYEQLNRGQVEAGMVQEPSLTLLERGGGKVLVNFMKLDDANKWLGGPYQFLALSARPETLTEHNDIAKGLIKGLVLANRWVIASPGSEIVKAMPEELVAGGDVDTFAGVLDRFKGDLYPSDGKLAADSVQRVIQVQSQFGAIEPGSVDANRIFTNTYVEQAIAGLPVWNVV